VHGTRDGLVKMAIHWTAAAAGSKQEQGAKQDRQARRGQAAVEAHPGIPQCRSDGERTGQPQRGRNSARRTAFATASNLVLDELDRELECRGHRFVRYADDCNIYVRSERAGQRVMQSITRFITEKLKLKVCGRAQRAVFATAILGKRGRILGQTRDAVVVGCRSERMCRPVQSDGLPIIPKPPIAGA
jgi:hypothetical protein